MTPDPVPEPVSPRTLIDTTEGSTRAATAAKDVGLATLPLAGAGAVVNDDVGPLPLSPSIAAPMPTPAAPKTSADTPAAAAGTSQPRRGRRGPGGGGAPGRARGPGAAAGPGRP